MQWSLDFDADKALVAVQLARAAIEAAPEHPGRWLALGRVLTALGDFPEAVRSMREAVTILPASAQLHAALAMALQSQSLFEDALPCIETALALAPANAAIHRQHFEVVASLGLWEKTNYDLTSSSAQVASNARLIEKLSREAGTAGTLEMCNALLEENPAHTNAKFLKALALARLGRDEDARQLMNLDELSEITALPPPPGHDGEDSWLQALADEIRANPTLVADPRQKATRGGQQTRRLRQPGAVAVPALLGLVRDAVDAYEKRLIASGHAFLDGAPPKVRLEAWAVIYGAQGRQRAHRHPDGWISGVFYVAAPRPHDENAYRGPLLMGALDPQEHGVAPPWGTREIEPVPGRLVLFPSYVPHATEPTGVDGARISVAFDVVPVP